MVMAAATAGATLGLGRGGIVNHYFHHFYRGHHGLLIGAGVGGRAGGGGAPTAPRIINPPANYFHAGGDTTQAFSKILPAHLRKHKIKLSQSKGGVVEMDLSVIQAIELAIAHELEARKSYLALAEDTDDLELQHLLREIAAEEAGHEASLRSRLRLYQQRTMLRETLSRYVSPAMCEEILKNPESIQLGGQRRHLTVLFADISGFTSPSEKMAPEAVVEMLNTFFTQMVDLIFEHQGTLDKFLGDGLMAVFGAPLELPQAAGQAVACSLAMHRRLKEMKAAGKTPIQGMRIGINTGEAIMGNIGSEKRMDFTIIGDVVNVASRLLELARDLEAEIMMGETTYKEMAGGLGVIPGPQVVLRGREEPTRSYRVMVAGTP